MQALRSSFRPEFLNRVDDTVLFKPLTVEEIKKIIELLLDEIRSRLQERAIDLTLTEAAKAMIESRIPLGRYGTSEEVANVIAFLCSDEAAYVTGSFYTVDGGMTNY